MPMIYGALPAEMSPDQREVSHRILVSISSKENLYQASHSSGSYCTVVFHHRFYLCMLVLRRLVPTPRWKDHILLQYTPLKYAELKMKFRNEYVSFVITYLQWIKNENSINEFMNYI